MKSGTTGGKLGDKIKKAILDLEITHTEYEEILNLAHEDHVIDEQEKSQLKQLHEMIANGTIKRVRG